MTYFKNTWVTDKLSDAIEKEKESCFGVNSQLGIFFGFAYLCVWFFFRGLIDKTKITYDVKIKGWRWTRWTIIQNSSSEEPLIHSVC